MLKRHLAMIHAGVGSCNRTDAIPTGSVEETLFSRVDWGKDVVLQWAAAAGMRSEGTLESRGDFNREAPCILVRVCSS